MKRSTATGKNEKFVIIALTCTCRVCKRCCRMAENEVSALRLLIGLQVLESVLRY